MKKVLNNSGFAMVETLIAAVSVISIFALLYNLIYPLLGGYKASQNYDDLDSKYVAFYVKEMIETDQVDISKQLLNREYNVYQTYAYINDQEGEKRVNIHDIDIDPSGQSEHYYIKNELCELLISEGNMKNNRFFCNKYVAGANVTKIYLLKYETTNFKNIVKDAGGFSRSFKKYVEYMPTHSAAVADKKNNYYRIIVEIEHDSYNTAGNRYYSYASIEVKK